MKRKHIIKYQYLYRHFSLFFWTKCCGCDKDFRREWGWYAVSGPYCNGMDRKYYLCKTCAPTKSIAADFFLNHKCLKVRPPRPTPPPPKRAREALG